MKWLLWVAAGWVLSCAAVAFAADDQSTATTGRIFYVRQTVGSDANDGLSPSTAWGSITQLGDVMQAGDTAYIGPGLYREKIVVRNSGTAEARIRLIADTTGEHTGDPSGVVLLTGADPIDESIFRPHSAPGVYEADALGKHVLGVTQMDGPQYRFARATDTKEHRVEKRAPLDVVAQLPSSFHYDGDSGVFYIHTSDGKSPTEHEIEVIHRGNGIILYEQHFVTIVGFTVRHVGDGGISFWTGSSNAAAFNNTSYGGRQGIRVYAATNILAYGNTLFRNDNSGIYFAKKSTEGYAIDNVMYENIKGIRWGSESTGGLAVGNQIFDNHEAGISIEGKADGARLAGNTLANNTISQLLISQSQFDSDGNCFQNGSPEQRTALFQYTFRHASLAEYQQAENRDLASRENHCDLPEKVDVRALHAETMAYAERARQLLAGGKSPASEETFMERLSRWWRGDTESGASEP